jgi:calcineurin-like phosphoesterase family protein
MQYHGKWLPAALLGCWLAAALCSSASAGEAPPRFHLAAPQGSLTFVVYGDTRFTEDESVANAPARRALVAGVVRENPAAIFIGGDLVYQGDDSDDYATYENETAAWSGRGIPVFPALGNHELRGCRAAHAVSPCLESWWRAFPALRPWRWYAVAMGSSLLVLVLDSDASLKSGSAQRTWLERQISDADSDARVRFILVLLHYPPVRDPIFPRGKDEALVQRYLSDRAPTLRARVIVVGSHVHNYERFERDGVTYLVSGGGGAKPLPVLRMSGELSQLRTPVNFHYLRMTLAGDRLTGTMVRFEATDAAGDPWSAPDRFEITSKPLRR